MKEVWAKGIKKTKQRESVLSVLLQADIPLNAKDIFCEAQKSVAVINLSTVYRILELFTKKGIICKDILSGDDTASYVMNSNQHRHYAVCISCHKTIALDDCPLMTMKNFDNFHITGHKLEIFGYCESCY